MLLLDVSIGDRNSHKLIVEEESHPVIVASVLAQETSPCSEEVGLRSMKVEVMLD